jgi:hypothetical protein
MRTKLLRIVRNRLLAPLRAVVDRFEDKLQKVADPHVRMALDDHSARHTALLGKRERAEIFSPRSGEVREGGRRAA